MKHYGVTVNVYLDGQGYDGGVTISCDHNGEFDFRCPHALDEIMPMQSGQHCVYKCGGECRVARAKLEALQKCDRMIKAKIHEIEEELAQ